MKYEPFRASDQQWDDHAEAKERAASPQLTFLRAVAIAVNEDHRLNQALTATQLVNLCVEKEITIPGLNDNLQGNTDAGKKQVGLITGKLFGDANELTIEDFRVAKHEETGLNDQGNPKTLKKYTFNIISKATTQPPRSNPAQ